MKYAVVIEKVERNNSAYVPDLLGCVATGATFEEIENEICEAITFHDAVRAGPGHARRRPPYTLKTPVLPSPRRWL